MKTKLLLFLALSIIISVTVKAQWINKSFTFQTKLRQYRIYKPAIYNAANPASLVLTLHGLGDNMTNFSTIGMNYVADTANIIVIVPQAYTDPFAGAAWNSGAGSSGYFPNATINDMAFLNALIDTAIANYAIDQSRIYICGFSMGGFMTERMACESNTRIAAFASVAGTIGIGLTQCNPGRAIPIAHFHGTADGTVSYSANTYGINTDSLINFWVDNNLCNTTPTTSTFPDLVADGLTIDHYVYPNGQQNSIVELFKANGADHQWLYPPANDISYTIEIWKFFRRYTLSTSNVIPVTNNQNINVYPSPAKDLINISLPQSCIDNNYNIKLINIYGHVVISKTFAGNEYSLLLNNKAVKNGIYFLKINGDGVNYSKKVLIEK